MYRTILVPLDGSTFAEQALPYATALALANQAQIHLAVVHQPLPVWVQSTDANAMELEATQAEAAYLDGVAHTLLARGVPVVTPVVLRSPPGHQLAETAVAQGFSHSWLNRPAGEALAEYVEGGPVDLVIMASHGRGALSRLWIGSVADFLVRHVTIPILLVRPHEGDPVPERGDLRRALVPIDRSEDALEAAAAVARLGVDDVTITLLHVVEPIIPTTGAGLFYPSGSDEGLTREVAASAEAHLAQAVAELKAKGLPVVGQRVVVGDVVGEILAACGHGGAFDLIALTTHGEGGFRRLLLGSVTDKVIRGSECPVLVHRPGEARR